MTRDMTSTVAGAGSSAADLAYVAGALRRRETSPTPWTIALVWAVYSLVGFTMIDFVPRYSGWWFLVAAVVGGVLSAFFGAREDKRTGEQDEVQDRRIMLHWSSIFVAVGAVAAITMTQHLDGKISGQFTTMAVGLVYFLAGAHFDRRYIPLGLLIMVGSVVAGLVPVGAWTAIGVVIAVGLMLLSLAPRKVVPLAV